jgi:hypothetical protein
MHGLLNTRDDIDRYVRTLHFFDDRARMDGDEDAVAQFLTHHTITVEPGVRDSYEGGETPLPYWLSLLRDPERLDRVSSVEIWAEKLDRDGLRLLRQVLRGSQARVIVAT